MSIYLFSYSKYGQNWIFRKNPDTSPVRARWSNQSTMKSLATVLFYQIHGFRGLYLHNSFLWNCFTMSHMQQFWSDISKRNLSGFSNEHYRVLWRDVRYMYENCNKFPKTFFELKHSYKTMKSKSHHNHAKEQNLSFSKSSHWRF